MEQRYYITGVLSFASYFCWAFFQVFPTYCFYLFCTRHSHLVYFCFHLYFPSHCFLPFGLFLENILVWGNRVLIFSQKGVHSLSLWKHSSTPPIAVTYEDGRSMARLVEPHLGAKKADVLWNSATKRAAIWKKKSSAISIVPFPFIGTAPPSGRFSQPFCVLAGEHNSIGMQNWDRVYLAYATIISVS